MKSKPVPDDLRRFVLTSIASVPHLEALLLLREAPRQEWDCASVAKRLYIAEGTARKLLDELLGMGVLMAVSSSRQACFRYAPQRAELGRLIDRLAEAYSANLVEITGLIHSKLDRQAQQFADAFTWRKEE